MGRARTSWGGAWCGRAKRSQGPSLRRRTPKRCRVRAREEERSARARGTMPASVPGRAHGRATEDASPTGFRATPQER